MKTLRIYQNDIVKNQGDLWGLFFEDINHAADGGLYAELVRNRSFEFCEIDRREYTGFTAWEKSEDTIWEINTEKPLNEENKHYLSVEATENSWVRNMGYNTGIYLEEGKRYDFSMYARTEKDVEIEILLTDEADNVISKEKLTLNDNSWKYYELEMKSSKTTCNGRLKIVFKEGKYDLDMVSLFPQDTFMGRKKGLRKDIAEALKEMKPKFMRFPGGCLTHSGSLNDTDRDSMYRWRRTLGKIEERPVWKNNWGYNQTLGIGYYEYFVFCEDIGTKALPVLPGGFNPHNGQGVPMDELGAWVKEALDLIEFANGSVDTPMGKIRAEMGHPDTFNLEYIGIGNEEIGDGFFERYPYFHNAIREKYPDIKIINTAGPFAVGEGYEAGWTSAKKYGSDLIDEHYYSSPEWFIGNMHHYDDYDENGPKVFLGEYASAGNTYYNAIVEAAYMTHLERAKAVALACYAPMLCNVDYVNWKPDMLWYNNHAIMKTPNYYVQKMFMENQGTHGVRIEMENLDEIVKIFDKENLAGDISIAGNDVEGRIWDVKVTDRETGKVISVDEIKVEKDNKETVITNIDSKEYTLEFKFLRSAGRKGLKIFFGKQNKDNWLIWDFGGWDNWDCNISSIINGRGSVISHRIFHVEDKEYECRLEVSGRTIKTYLNGEMWNETTDHLPELEELYVSANIDKESGNTIVKVVNLTGEEKNTDVILDGDIKNKAEIVALRGCELSAENELDKPEKVSPVNEKMDVKDNVLNYTFPPHSVSVITFIK